MNIAIGSVQFFINLIINFLLLVDLYCKDMSFKSFSFNFAAFLFNKNLYEK